MALSVEQVRHVASLARLSLNPEEEARARQQLSAILDAMQTLASVDTTGVEVTSHVTDAAPLRRTDEVGVQLTPEQALGNAPQTSGTSFAIPKVLE